MIKIYRFLLIAAIAVSSPAIAGPTFRITALSTAEAMHYAAMGGNSVRYGVHVFTDALIDCNGLSVSSFFATLGGSSGGGQDDFVNFTLLVEAATAQRLVEVYIDDPFYFKNDGTDCVLRMDAGATPLRIFFN